MRPSLNPRKLAHIGHARGWAAVAFEGSQLKLTTARAEGAEVTLPGAITNNVMLCAGRVAAMALLAMATLPKAVIAACVFLAAAECRATTYYVSVSGNDSNSGTSAAPS